MDNSNYIILMSDFLELFEHFFVKTAVILIRQLLSKMAQNI